MSGLRCVTRDDSGALSPTGVEPGIDQREPSQLAGLVRVSRLWVVGVKLVDPAYPWFPRIYRAPGDGGFAQWVANWREYSTGGTTRWRALAHVVIYRLLQRFPDLRWKLMGWWW